MAWGDDQKGQLGVEESPSEEEQCYGETHAITPIQCSTVPRPVKVAGLGVLTGVERIGAGEEAAYAVRAGGREVLAWGGGGKGQLGNGEDNESASPVKATFEPPSPGDRNRRRLTARAGAAGQRRGLRLGRRRPRPARIRNRRRSDRKLRPPEMQHDPPGRRRTRPRGGRGGRRRRRQLRPQRRRRRQQGDLLVRGRRLLRTARARQPVVHQHLHAHPDRRHRLGAGRLRERHHGGRAAADAARRPPRASR